jgi:hypothetical protein
MTIIIPKTVIAKGGDKGNLKGFQQPHRPPHPLGVAMWAGVFFIFLVFFRDVSGIMPHSGRILQRPSGVSYY